MTTGISWCDETWNPVVGCEAVSAGCDFCYAKSLHDMRHEAYLDGKLQNIPQYAEPFETVQLMPDRLTKPLSWKKPKRIFVNSMSDLFHRKVPVAFLDDVFTVAAIAMRHTFQILTKRPARARDYLNDPDLLERLYCNWPKFSGSPAEVAAWPLPNVWMGTSVENQAMADKRVPLLLDTLAAVRWLSCEPMLGPIELDRWLKVCKHWKGEDSQPTAPWHPPYPKHWYEPQGLVGAGWTRPLHWIVGGGESGTKNQQVRPVHPMWARSLRDQCVAAGVPFHWKQWGNYAPFGYCSANSLNAEGPDGEYGYILGPADEHGFTYVYGSPANLKRNGRLLDGKLWDQFPFTTADQQRGA